MPHPRGRKPTFKEAIKHLPAITESGKRIPGEPFRIRKAISKYSPRLRRRGSLTPAARRKILERGRARIRAVERRIERKKIRA